MDVSDLRWDRSDDAEDLLRPTSRFCSPFFARAGAIPEALGALTKLEVCVLYNNNLSGTPATAVVVFVRLISPRHEEPNKADSWQGG